MVVFLCWSVAVAVAFRNALKLVKFPSLKIEKKLKMGAVLELFWCCLAPFASSAPRARSATTAPPNPPPNPKPRPGSEHGSLFSWTSVSQRAEWTTKTTTTTTPPPPPNLPRDPPIRIYNLSSSTTPVPSSPFNFTTPTAPATAASSTSPPPAFRAYPSFVGRACRPRATRADAGPTPPSLSRRKVDRIFHFPTATYQEYDVQNLDFLLDAVVAPSWFNLEGEMLRAKVSEVDESDTVTVVFNYGGKFWKDRCRLAGITTTGVHAATSADDTTRNWLRAKLLDKKVWVECGKWDNHGRLIGIIYLNSNFQTSVNQEMVESGLARVYTPVAPVAPT